jgi:hypothetical protein
VRSLPDGGFWSRRSTNVGEIAGSSCLYVKTNRVLAVTNGVMVFEGGNLTAPLTNAVMLTATNKVIDLSLTNKLSLSLTVFNGTFAGSVREPDMTRSNSFKGVLLQNENSGCGYFLETNRSGRLLFWSAP